MIGKSSHKIFGAVAQLQAELHLLKVEKYSTPFRKSEILENQLKHNQV